jgi:DNA polymerase-3 subunit chi
MTRVDFYLLGKDSDRREVFACRLAEKAYRLGHRVYLLAPDLPAATELDELLWTFSQGSFVPHALLDSDPAAKEHPVLVGHAEPPGEFNDVLITLAGEVPPWFSRFARVAELVGTDDPEKARARDRFRFYRERGTAPETHPL